MTAAHDVKPSSGARALWGATVIGCWLQQHVIDVDAHLASVSTAHDCLLAHAWHHESLTC